MRKSGIVLCLLAASICTVCAFAGEEPEAAEASPSQDRFRLKAEIKVNFRHSAVEEVKVKFPFPPEMIPPGQDGVYERTTAGGSSLELSNLALIGEADLTPDITGLVRIHILDLYNRNPTSSDDRITVREAWVRFGKKSEAFEASSGSSFYAILGKAPRFSRQPLRRLESYGLWGTALGRFEQLQLQVGGSFGRNLYWRAHIANGNPLFMRDPNALAGDNGTPERAPGNIDPVYESGFPILYDAKASEVNLSGNVEGGVGLGFRWLREGSRDGADVMGWYFKRRLADEVPIRGSFYEGDLDLLKGAGIPLPFRGDSKEEYGVNAEARVGGLHAFVQYVHQDIAELVRKGYEAELGYRLKLNGLFALGDTPVLYWVEPAFRYSTIDNRFRPPSNFVAPSMGWDWRKYDIGLRVGIVSGVDITAEYARHDMILLAKTLHPDEMLVTLRAGF